MAGMAVRAGAGMALATGMAVLMLLEKEVDAYLLERSRDIELKVANFVELNRDKPGFLKKKIGGYVTAVKTEFQQEVDKVVARKLKKLAEEKAATQAKAADAPPLAEQDTMEESKELSQSSISRIEPSEGNTSADLFN